MQEREIGSIKDYFAVFAPELLEYLDSDDIFWKQIKNNTITDEELTGHEALLSELGMNRENSEVAKAVWLIREGRKNILPTPVRFKLG